MLFTTGRDTRLISLGVLKSINSTFQPHPSLQGKMQLKCWIDGFLSEWAVNGLYLQIGMLSDEGVCETPLVKGSALFPPLYKGPREIGSHCHHPPLREEKNSQSFCLLLCDEMWSVFISLWTRYCEKSCCFPFFGSQRLVQTVCACACVAWRSACVKCVWVFVRSW